MMPLFPDAYKHHLSTIFKGIILLKILTWDWWNREKFKSKHIQLYHQCSCWSHSTTRCQAISRNRLRLRQTQTDSDSDRILFNINRNQVSYIRLQKITWWKIKCRLNAWHDEYAYWETSIKVRPDRLHRNHPEESTWPGVLIILMTIMSVHQIS